MKNLIILLAIIALPCREALLAQDTPKPTTPRLEVYYFHATMRCATCMAVEEQSRKTLEEQFAEELKNGSVVLQVLNLEDKENKALTEKFEIGWSSLILFVPSGEKTANITEMAFSKARSHPEEFRKELEKQIREML